MGLLTALGLKPSKAMLKAAASAAPPEEEVAAAAEPEPMLGEFKTGQVIGGDDDSDGGGGGAAEGEDADGEVKPRGKQAPAADAPTRQQAAAIAGQLEARYDQLAGARRKIAGVVAAKKQDAAKASASNKPLLDKVVKQYESALETADKRLAEVRKAIDNVKSPTASREDLVRALALAKSKDEVAAASVKEQTPGGNKLDRAQKVVETEYQDGQARIDTTEKGFVLDGNGLQHKDKESRERVDAEGSAKGSKETTYALGADGAKRTKATKTEFSADVDGEQKKWGTETKDELTIAPGGVKQTKELKVSNADGSSVSEKQTLAIVRGDGKLGAQAGGEKETVDADGNSVKKKAEAKAGLIADGKGMGAFAEGSGSATKKHKSGLEASGGLELKGNVKCEIGDPAGEPPMYPVTIEVNCGAEVEFGGGGESKGKGKAGIEVTLGVDYVFRQTHNLAADQLDGYVAAMNAANTGGVLDATKLELKVIATGVRETWQAAQRVAKGLGPLSPEMIAALANAGDSVELKSTTKKGAKVSGSAKYVEAEFGGEREDEESLKATKRKDGQIGVEAKQSQQDKLAGKAGLNFMDLGGASAGRSHTWKTGFGFDITVDPKKDADGKAMAALAKCKAKADYLKVVDDYKDRVTLNSVTDTKGEADKTEVGATVLGAKASIGTGNALLEEEKRDAKGKLIRKKTVGEQQAGGGIELPGGIKYGDSSDNKAEAESDAEGNASLKLSKTKNQSQAGKIVDAMKAKVGLGDDKKAKGLLQVVAGGGEEPDTQVHDVYGIKLKKPDLVKLGELSMSNKWNAPGGSNAKDVDAWRAAQRVINAAKGDPAIVAEQLSKFVGGSAKDRVTLLRQFLRPGGNVSIGMAFNFPEGMKKEQEEFEELVFEDCEKKVQALAKAKGPAEGAKLGHALMARLQQLTMRIKSAPMPDTAAQADMSSKCGERRTALAEVIRELEGRNSEADIKAARLEQFNRHVGNCQTAKRNLDEAFAALQKLRSNDPRMPQLDKNDHFDAVKKMYDLRATLRSELYAARKLAEEHGFPAARYEQFRADDRTVGDLGSWFGLRDPG